MRRMPRRLSYGEEATLVEHLEELRHRIFIILGALVLTTILAFVFHTHIIHWLNQPLPADRRRPGPLGAGGRAFGYFVLLPRAVHWLTSYDNKQFNNLVQAKPYYAFVSTVLLGIVVVFELPMVVLGLVSLGVLTSKTLRKNRRIGYFVTAVIALGLPGPDPVTTGLELLPMWVLFEASIWLAVYVEHRAASRLVAPGVSGS